MHVLRGSVTERSGKRLCLENSFVKVWGCGLVGRYVLNSWDARILLAEDKSGGQTALKMPRGPRWREFHCLAARPRIITWLVEALQVILLGARRGGTGQVVEQAGWW